MKGEQVHMKKVLLKGMNFIGSEEFETGNGMDISIDDDGLINKIAFNLSEEGYENVLDLSGFFLSPGWIDMHTHIYHGVSNLGVDPEKIGPKTGVTILVDAGSAGDANFQGFREHIIAGRDYPIFSFINIGSTGLIFANQISEFDSLEKINLDGLYECIDRNREYIKGIKVRASGVIMRGWGIEAVKLAKKAAREAGLPLMVHIGEPLPLLEDILPLLDNGDIVTHCFHGKRWGILDNKGAVLPEAVEAAGRGVRFDTGHGCASFSFKVAERAISSGFKPFSISTDLHSANVDGPVFNLALTMSKLLSLGLSLSEVIQCVTFNPAGILGVESYENGIVGKSTRFTVFSVENQPFEAMDSNGNTRIIEKVIKPRYVILGNRIIDVLI
ncbi:MAG: amidohydrolase/deacetylase family metallohydrolase [Ruminiclostridium sp.]|nr:amidohydrolase/deacetylase family metallohydrolase [Ruminiclostridium sp.]